VGKFGAFRTSVMCRVADIPSRLSQKCIDLSQRADAVFGRRPPAAAGSRLAKPAPRLLCYISAGSRSRNRDRDLRANVAMHSSDFMREAVATRLVLHAAPVAWRDLPGGNGSHQGYEQTGLD